MDFEEIYKTYFNDVYRYIRKLSCDEHVAEEIASETFFKAMRSIDTFRNECDFRVWLCQIAKNTYYTYLKRQNNLQDVEDSELERILCNGTLVAETVIANEESAAIRTILHTIPEPYKEVFMWRAFADLSFKQIGQIFGKSDNWACVTYHRARAMVKNQLEEKNRDV